MEKNFLDIPEEYARRDSADVLILPVAYDETATYLKGSVEGSRKIIESSAHLEWYDIELDEEPCKRGIHTLEEIRSHDRPEKFLPELEKIYAGLMEEGKLIAMLGGEHSITLPAVKAHLASSSELTVVHLDAHADLADEYEGTRFGHGCFLRRVHEAGARIVQAGIRSASYDEHAYAGKNEDIVSIPDHECRLMPDLPERIADLAGDLVYLTVDMDAFDPALVSGVGNPVPGGFDWYGMTDIIATLAAKRKIVGFDIVETRPLGDSVENEFIAARLVYKIIGNVFHNS